MTSGGDQAKSERQDVDPGATGEAGPEATAAQTMTSENEAVVDEADLAAAGTFGAAGEEPESTPESADGEAGAAPERDEVAELTEDLKRVSAEYSNYRRRVARDRDVAVAEAKAKVLTGLLEIADELGMAAQHGDLAEDGPLKKFNDKFFAVLAAQGVEEFGAPGDPFDPNLHEAVQDTSGGEEPKLDTVLRKGYRTPERVLRTAMVIVGA